jgi:hypothetical protein
MCPTLDEYLPTNIGAVNQGIGLTGSVISSTLVNLRAVSLALDILAKR